MRTRTSSALLHQVFDRVAARTPGAVAIDVPPGAGRPARRRVTYGDLARGSDAIARALAPVVTGESVVAILAGRNSEQLYAAQLGVLKAGAAYTCLDPAFPDEQIHEILSEAGAVALLADRAGWVRARRAGVSAPVLIDIGEAMSRDAEAGAAPAPPAWLHAHSLAYVIYTSGTTGRPKGVMIEHASIVNLVESDLREFHLTPRDRVGQGSSAAYDSSIEETWLAFAAGATLVVIDDDTTRLGPDLVEWLRHEHVTVFCPPPTLLRATGCQEPWRALPDLRLLYVGGEALPQDVADRWARGRRLVNGYGPTEVTVTSVRADVLEGHPIAIGKPVPGLVAHVLDDTLEPVPPGETGELCLAGAGLARGYRNLPDVTAEKFPQHPAFGRLYRTGDLVHRDRDGRLFYHGRSDAQVKLRGYRVELEAVEARLSSAEGVREAACRVQGVGAGEALIGFVVPKDPSAPPDLDHVRTWLRGVLPAYMVPARLAQVASLPKTVGGKLNRKALPVIEWRAAADARPIVVPKTDLEGALVSAVRKALDLQAPVSTDADFFEDLGGDSLRAALLISIVREDPDTASLTVRDVYEARTVTELAARVRPASAADAVAPAESGGRVGDAQIAFATLLQAVWLLVTLGAGAIALWFVVWVAWPFLTDRLGLLASILLVPTLLTGALALYVPLTLLAAVIVKRALIGRYRPTRAPVWSAFYVRHWIVQETAHMIPWRLLEGTVLQQAALRALGARIGRRVHIHRGVDLRQGGWDLLEIGDDVTISQDAELRLVDLDDGHIVIGSVTLERGVTLDVRAGVGPGGHLEADSCLTALSALPAGGRVPAGECWDGIPAQPSGRAPDPPAVPAESRVWRPASHAVAFVLARMAVAVVLLLPIDLAALFAVVESRASSAHAIAWLFGPEWDWPTLCVILASIVISVPVTVALSAAISRAMGRVHPGVISRWSPAYIRVWLKVDVLEFANTWLGGTLFWPFWLRAAGMDVGAGCEISTIIDVVPELVSIGPNTFLADGIYLNGPRVHRGTVTLVAEYIGQRVFLGNHVVIAGGQPLPDDVLLGVCTTGGGTAIDTRTAWFGHPPFALPRREVVACDARLTHHPSLVRYINRVFWEALRFALPIPTVLVSLAWVKGLTAAQPMVSWPVFLFGVVPVLTTAVPVSLCAMVVALKWLLLGRVKPGQHPLWCCWCSRWDFLYELWGFHAREALSPLEGTLLLSWYLRAMGVRIGRRVVLGHSFAQVVDPDMLVFDDDATVDGQFQAHTFEDRVLKIDTVHVGRRATVGSAAVLLYGADVGEGTHVEPHSVVMKKERLLPGRTYAGCPTRMVG